jgi:hypothetical protein
VQDACLGAVRCADGGKGRIQTAARDKADNVLTIQCN